MNAVDMIFDTDRWIRVPLDYADTPWRDAGEWADWLAQSATDGRPDAETVAPLVRSSARAVAQFPAAHVWARFWHYPVDAIPTGFADIYVQRRDPQFEPVVSEFETDHSPHGYRVAYVSDAQAEDGSRLAGIVYGLRFESGLGTVFSELADRDTTGLMQLHADPVVSSLRIVA